MKNNFSRRDFIKTLIGGVSAIGLTFGINPKVFSKSFKKLELMEQASNEEELWRLIRAQFGFDENVVYLNNGSVGASPRIVYDTVYQIMRQIESNPAGQFWGELPAKIEEVRKKLAEFLSISSEEIALVRNTTEGMSIVAQGLNLKKGDELITSTHEHPGGRFCWEYMAEKKGIVIKKIPLKSPTESKEVILDEIKKRITSKTKVFSFCHMNCTTGLIMPVKEIAELAKENSIFFAVDGAHPPGMMKVNIKDLGCDTYACSSHKWMLAPKGTGFLYVKKESQDKVDPLVVTAGYKTDNAKKYDRHGTVNIPHLIGLGIAVDFIKSIGIDNIEKHNRELSNYFKQKIEQIKGIKRYTSFKPEFSCGLSAVKVKGCDCVKLRDEIQNKFNVVLRPVTDDNLNAIRVSTHLYNTKQQVDKCIDILKNSVKS